MLIKKVPNQVVTSYLLFILMRSVMKQPFKVLRPSSSGFGCTEASPQLPLSPLGRHLAGILRHLEKRAM